MNSLIQRLRNLYVQNGTNYVQAAADALEKQQAEIEELRAKILAMACVQVDREEALEAECAKWKAKAYENSGLVPTDNVAKENQVLRAEIERLKGHIKHIGNDALRAELEELKAQAAKDAADAGRRLNLIIIAASVVHEAQVYTSCETWSPSMTLELLNVGHALDIEIMKESQQ